MTGTGETTESPILRYFEFHHLGDPKLRVFPVASGRSLIPWIRTYRLAPRNQWPSEAPLRPRTLPRAPVSRTSPSSGELRLRPPSCAMSARTAFHTPTGRRLPAAKTSATSGWMTRPSSR